MFIEGKYVVLARRRREIFWGYFCVYTRKMRCFSAPQARFFLDIFVFIEGKCVDLARRRRENFEVLHSKMTFSYSKSHHLASEIGKFFACGA